jgi:hypothetical protein
LRTVSAAAMNLKSWTETDRFLPATLAEHSWTTASPAQARPTASNVSLDSG